MHRVRNEIKKEYIEYWNLNKVIGWDLHEKKKTFTLKKPIYVGFTVLETTEWEMYNVHYNFMTRKFKARLLFTDIDSLRYELHEKNPYKKCLSTKNYLI